MKQQLSSMRKLLNGPSSLSRFAGESGLVHTLPLLVIIAAIGLISFLFITSTLPITGLIGDLNPKPQSKAADLIPSPFPNCQPFGGVVPVSQATPPFNPMTYIGGLEAEPMGPIWCFPLGVKQPTRIAGPNDWVDDFNAGMMGRLNDNDMDYRLFEMGTQSTLKQQQFINANHWMVDIVDLSDTGRSGGLMMSPKKKFFFENAQGQVCTSGAPGCKLVIEIDAAAGADGMGGADQYYEVDISTAAQPANYSEDDLYGYGQFGTDASIGTRMEGGNFLFTMYDTSNRATDGHTNSCVWNAPNCPCSLSLYQQNEAICPSGRVWETQGVGYALAAPGHIGNDSNFLIPGGNGLRMRDVLRGCKSNQMDYFCRDRIRWEITKDNLKVLVNGYLVFELPGLYAVHPTEGHDSRVPEEFFKNGVYVYLTSWINGPGHRTAPLRWHWDRLAVNPHDVPGHGQPPTYAPSFCLGGIENNSCSILTSDSSGINVPGKNQVEILDFVYNTSNVNITAGDTVTWTNKGNQEHTVTAEDGSFGSGSTFLKTGQTYSHKFDTPGVYPYFCVPHPGMKGTVTVYPAGGGPVPTTAPTPGASPTVVATLNAILKGASETPTNNSSANGTSQLQLMSNNTASVSLSFSGLSSGQTAAHIHGPAAAGVGPAPIIVGVPNGNFTNNTVTFTPAQITDLRAGLYYINVHSSNFTAGEIRGQFLMPGQITPAPSASPACKQGDIDCDGDVDIFDFNILVSNFGQIGANLLGDLDTDGDIDIFDFNSLIGNFGN